MRKPTILSRVTLLAVAAYLGALAGSGIASAASDAVTADAAIPENPLREAYFGDLHLHTSYSFDAYVMDGTRADPETAYRFGRGEPVEYLGQMVQRREPLDFLAVTDHAENIGVFNQLEDPNSAISRSEQGKALRQAIDAGADVSARIDVLRRFGSMPDRGLPQTFRLCRHRRGTGR